MTRCQSELWPRGGCEVRRQTEAGQEGGTGWTELRATQGGSFALPVSGRPFPKSAVLGASPSEEHRTRKLSLSWAGQGGGGVADGDATMPKSQWKVVHVLF